MIYVFFFSGFGRRFAVHCFQRCVGFRSEGLSSVRDCLHGGTHRSAKSVSNCASV